MNNNLNHGKLKYDGPRYNEMYVFLNHILAIVKSNPKLYLSDKIVYNELKKFTLPRKDLNQYGQPKSSEHLFREWINDFKSIKNISVYNSENWKYWCQFVNQSYGNNYIKIYVPLDGDGLYECVEDIFKFMAKHNMSHQSKVAKELRNDNVVIRLDKGDEKSLRLLLDYINTNPKIQSHLNKTNPFLPSIDGIGVMNETGISYNDELCKTIARYININKNLESINVEDFIEYMNRYTYKKEVYEAFNHATSNEIQYFDANEQIEGYVSIKAREEQKNIENPKFKKETKQLTDLQKHSLLNDTIKATYEKYGLIQAVTALSHAINREYYNYFTNGYAKYREQLKQNVSGQEIKTYIEKTLSQVSTKIYENVYEMARDYCEIFFKEDSVAKLDEMCQVTLDNYDMSFLKGAIHNFIFYGKTNGFSRFKKNTKDEKNYRENCKHFDSKTMLSTMRRSMQMKGINTNVIRDDELISCYVNALNNSNYQKLLDEKEYGSFSR